MERLVIDVLQQCVTIKRAGVILRMSWDEVWGVMARAVRRGQQRKQDSTVTRYGVDEKAFRKGHSYMTVISDLDRATVEHVSEARTTESLKTYWQSLGREQLESIESVSMDMWDPYIQATLSVVPGADQKIVFDRFHIMRHVLKAVDMVRKQEHRILMAEGDDSLKKTKYLWLYNEENIPERHWPKLDVLRAMCLKVGKAHAIKESFRLFWDYRRASWAKRFFDSWYWWSTHSRLEPMRRVAHTIKDHLWGILNYFKHRVTNAVSEGLNSKIMAIKRLAGGYRNKEHFKISIYFHCGGLDLYPR
jgi:transposase